MLELERLERERDKEQIKMLRQRLGWTQREFASNLGVTEMTIRRWEAGRYSPSPLAWEKLKQLYNSVAEKVT